MERTKTTAGTMIYGGEELERWLTVEGSVERG